MAKLKSIIKAEIFSHIYNTHVHTSTSNLISVRYHVFNFTNWIHFSYLATTTIQHMAITLLYITERNFAHMNINIVTVQHINTTTNVMQHTTVNYFIRVCSRPAVPNMLFREQELSLQNVLSLSPVHPCGTLPADLRVEHDTSVFKCKLKRYPFRSAFTQ